MKIKWTNISSGEQGYVMSLNDDGKDFVNTFLAEEAAGFAVEEAQKKGTGCEGPGTHRCSCGDSKPHIPPGIQIRSAFPAGSNAESNTGHSRYRCYGVVSEQRTCQRKDKNGNGS